MKKNIMCVLLVLLLSISITACSSKKSSSNANKSTMVSSNKISETSVPTSNSTDSKTTESKPTDSKSTDSKSENNNLGLKAYKDVLQNKANFFNTDNKKNKYLNDILKEQYPGDTLKVTRFAVLDMDGDNIAEVVLELSNKDNNPMCFEILHYKNSKVYGYNIVYRGLLGLKADGTAWSSGGAADHVCQKLRFEADSFKTDILAESKSSQNKGVLTISYAVNNKSVTKEAFDAFSKGQDAKKDVVWYDFSQNNIETKLSTNSNSASPKDASKKQEYTTKLSNIEVGLKDLDKRDAGTTADMVYAANERYKKWDTALNEIYNVLKGQLSSSDMKKLQSEEIQWISNRDATAKKAASEAKGGTLEPVLYNGSLADTTKKRCYELVEKYML